MSVSYAPHGCRRRFKAFHERYYHPSNGRFWFYGDDPPQERLRLLGAFLDEFEARPVDSAVTAQPLFSVRACLGLTRKTWNPICLRGDRLSDADSTAHALWYIGVSPR